MFTTFAFFTAATISAHSSTSIASGFSQRSLAVPSRLEGDLAVAVIGRADVDDIDLRIAHDGFPISACPPPTKLLAGGIHILRRTPADGVKRDIGRQYKKLRYLAPRIRVRLSHEVVTNHSDIERASSHDKGEEPRLQNWIADPKFPLVWRLQEKFFGSGANGDIDSHIIDLARYLVGEISEVCGLMETFIKKRPVLEEVGKGLGAKAGKKLGTVTGRRCGIVDWTF